MVEELLAPAALLYGCISEGSPPPLLAKLEGKTHLRGLQAEQGFSWLSPWGEHKVCVGFGS